MFLPRMEVPFNLRRTSWVENDPEHRKSDTRFQPFTLVIFDSNFIYNHSFLHHIKLSPSLTSRCKMVFPTLQHNTPTLYFVGRNRPILLIWKILRGSFSTHTFCRKNTSWVVFDPYNFRVKNLKHLHPSIRFIRNILLIVFACPCYLAYLSKPRSSILCRLSVFELKW